MIKKIIIDLDGVVFDTIQTIVDLYNIDHIAYKDFRVVMPSEIKTWDFDELSLESPEYIDKYFNMPRFFSHLVLMNGAKWIVNRLYNEGFDIVFCSSGSYPNLQLKHRWISSEFPQAEFIPVEMPTYADKGHIPMEDSIFIDDCNHNLVTSNAPIKICFGETYSWNEEWNGKRCKNWIEVYQYIKELKNEGTI